MAPYEITAGNIDPLEEGSFPDSHVFRVVSIATPPSANTPPRFRRKCLAADPAEASLRPRRLPFAGKGQSA